MQSIVNIINPLVHSVRNPHPGCVVTIYSDAIFISVSPNIPYERELFYQKRNAERGLREIVLVD